MEDLITGGQLLYAAATAVIALASFVFGKIKKK